MSIIVERLKTLVLKKGVSQSELAEQLGMDRSYLSKLLNNKEGINTKYVERILELCGYTIDDLCTVSDSSMEKRIEALEEAVRALQSSQN